LVKGAMYTTATEGKFKYEAENNKVNFDFVMVPFSSIKDSDVKITDEEIVAYMKTKEKKIQIRRFSRSGLCINSGKTICSR